MKRILTLLLLLMFFSVSAFAGIPKDKKKHFVLGVVVSLPTIFLKHNPLTAFAVSFGVGLLKEVKDGIENQSARRRGRSIPHRVEANDLHATGLGGIIVFLVKIIKDTIC